MIRAFDHEVSHLEFVAVTASTFTSLMRINGVGVSDYLADLKDHALFQVLAEAAKVAINVIVVPNMIFFILDDMIVVADKSIIFGKEIDLDGHRAV